MDKLWLKQYQKDIAQEIDPNKYSSLIELFNESFNKFKKQTAYINMGVELNFADLDTQSRHFAAYLQQLGLEKGMRVAIMLPNILQYPVALFGILRAGLIVVNTNPLYTKDEFLHQISDAGATAVIVLANFAHIVASSIGELPTLKHVIVTELGDGFPTFKRLVVNSVVKYVKRMVPDYSSLHTVKFKDALHIGSVSKLSPVTLTHEDIAFIQYTGGTTGVLKGAILTHKNLIANILQISAWIYPMNIGKDDIIVTALPLYHIFSLTANCLTFFKLGAKNLLITNPRDTENFIKQIKNINFTAITGVNTLFGSLLNHPKFNTICFKKLKLSLSGGMALQKTTSLNWRKATNAPILEAYGLTETSPAVTINPLSLKEYNGSIGLPIPSTEISIRDPKGYEVSIGEIGELCVYGPQVMPGYWHRPDESSLVFWSDGFLRTGDGAKIDEFGYVYLVDRIKDLIIMSGFNVYPNEVEQVIGQMPEVLEVAIIGVSTKEGVEEVKACIVKREPHLTKEDVIAYCRQHLTAYKIPKLVEFYNDLPKSNVGKVLKRALRNPQ